VVKEKYLKLEYLVKGKNSMLVLCSENIAKELLNWRNLLQFLCSKVRMTIWITTFASVATFWASLLTNLLIDAEQKTFSNTFFINSSNLRN
jgi:hypothetical protein